MNLNGYTKGARNEIFALEPAPVQVRCRAGAALLAWQGHADQCKEARGLGWTGRCVGHIVIQPLPRHPRLPPRQASYLGFPATTGAPFLPWLILDKVGLQQGWLSFVTKR